MNESESGIASTDAEIKRQRRLAQYRKYYVTHKEKVRDYYQKNKDKFAKRCVKWRKANLERHRENNRRLYARNPARRVASTLKHQRKNAAKRKAYMSKWRLANKEHLRKYDQAKRRTPEGRIAAIQAHHRRQALKNKCVVRATKTDIARFMASAKSCHYCGTTTAKLTLDHFIALVRGGAHSVENFVAACKSCNSSKKDRDPYDFMLYIRTR